MVCFCGLMQWQNQRRGKRAVGLRAPNVKLQEWTSQVFVVHSTVAERNLKANHGEARRILKTRTPIRATKNPRYMIPSHCSLD